MAQRLQYSAMGAILCQKGFLMWFRRRSALVGLYAEMRASSATMPSVSDGMLMSMLHGEGRTLQIRELTYSSSDTPHPQGASYR